MVQLRRIHQQEMLEAELETAFDHGRGWFWNHPQALVVEAFHYGSNRYDCDGLGKQQTLAFVEGFTHARYRREQWLRNK